MGNYRTYSIIEKVSNGYVVTNISKFDNGETKELTREVLVCEAKDGHDFEKNNLEALRNAFYSTMDNIGENYRDKRLKIEVEIDSEED